MNWGDRNAAEPTPTQQADIAAERASCLMPLAAMAVMWALLLWMMLWLFDGGGPQHLPPPDDPAWGAR